MKIETAISKAADVQSSHAVSGVQIVPCGDGGVYTVATNGKHLAVVRQDGECDDKIVLPADLLRKPPVSIAEAENGEFRRKDNSAVGRCVSGRFPRVAAVLPEVTDDYVPVVVSARSLKILADALGDDVLVLFVPPDAGGQQGVAPIPVLCGSAGVGKLQLKKPGQVQGFGLMVPCTDKRKLRDEYNKFCDRFKKDYKDARERKSE